MRVTVLCTYAEIVSILFWNFALEEIALGREM